MVMFVLRNIVIVLAALVGNRGHAQYYYEYRGSYATEILNPGPTNLNPATYLRSGQEAYGGVYQTTNQDQLTRKTTGQDTIESTVGTTEAMGAGVVFDLGGGLNLGLSHQRVFDHQTSENSRSTARRAETWKYDYTQAKAAIQLTDTIQAGLLIRRLEEENHVVGNPFLNQASTTSYRSGLFGAGGGLYMMFPNATPSFEKVAVSLSYIPALKGKSEIYGEERILTDPGLASSGIGVQSGKFGFAIRTLRHVHKEQERADETVFPNEDQTSVSPLGLDVNRLYFYPLEETHLGFSYQVGNDLTAFGGIHEKTIELAFGTKDTVSAGHLNEAWRGKILSYKGGVELARNNLVFGVGVEKSWPKIEWADEDTNRGDFEYVGRQESVFLSVRKP